MRNRHCCTCLILVLVCLGASGCKKKGASDGSGPSTYTQAQIDRARDAMTRDMQRIAFSNLKQSHVGKNCVIMADTMDDKSKLGPPPPPPGMVQFMGPTTFYRGELESIAPGTLTVKSPYPTPGRFKKLEIDKEDIQSVHIAP